MIKLITYLDLLISNDIFLCEHGVKIDDNDILNLIILKQYINSEY